MTTHLSDLASDERSARIVLSHLSEPGDERTGSVVRRASALEALKLAESPLMVPGLNDADSLLWQEQLAAKARDLRYEIDIDPTGVLVPGDDNWPTSLNDLRARAPLAIWVTGDASLLSRPAHERTTITGARAATTYGEHVSADIARELADAGTVIVAGGSYGIEAAAHRSSLAEGKPSIAVIANGIDRHYPAGHADLFADIASTGAVVSELPPGSAPTRAHFIARSRLLAALSDTTIIVEAGARSMALRTAAEAESLRRGIGAVPGPVTSSASNGAHELIRTGTAQLVTSGRDVRLLQADRAAPLPTRSVFRESPGQTSSRMI